MEKVYTIQRTSKKIKIYLALSSTGMMGCLGMMIYQWEIWKFWASIFVFFFSVNSCAKIEKWWHHD